MTNEALGLSVTGTVHCNGRYLLVRRAREEGDPLAGFWAFPGGRVQYQIGADGKPLCETLTQALARELSEEVGVSFDSAFYVDSYQSLGKRAGVHFCVDSADPFVSLNAELDDFVWIESYEEMLSFTPIIPGLINHLKYIEYMIHRFGDPFVSLAVLDLTADRYIG